MIVDFAIAPIGKGESLSQEIAGVFSIIEASGLPYEHHAMGTNLEGEWDDVFAVIKACRNRLLEDWNRVSISIKVDDRKDGEARMNRKVDAARARM